MTKRLHFIYTTMLICLMFTACTNNNDVSTDYELSQENEYANTQIAEENLAQEEVPIIETDTNNEPDTETVQTKSIIVSVLNFSNIDIGMFAVIDPVTLEQVNVDSLESGTTISIECNWPIDTKEFHWAMYNTKGELCMDATTNIEDATQSVTLAVSGENTIDDFEVIIE